MVGHSSLNEQNVNDGVHLKGGLHLDWGKKILPRHFAWQNATPQEGIIKIDISSLPPGVYLIKIGDKFEKFVKL
jgi:hypothetical protein